MTGEEARKIARAVAQNIHGLCPGDPIAEEPTATCSVCNMSRLTLDELVWHTLRPGGRAPAYRAERTGPTGDPVTDSLSWALDLLDKYDERLAQIDGAAMVYTPVHIEGKALARRVLKSLEDAMPWLDE